MTTSIFSLPCSPKKKYLFISIQILGLTYNLIINCNTILWAALYVGNIFISYNRPANFCQPYSICPYMGKIPIKSMEVYCLRVIEFIRKGLVVKAPVCDLGNQTDFQVPPQTSHWVLRRVIYPLNTCSPPKASVINNISLLQWEVGRTHQSCSARVRCSHSRQHRNMGWARAMLVLTSHLLEMLSSPSAAKRKLSKSIYWQ